MVKVSKFQADYVIIATLRGDKLGDIAKGIGKSEGWIRNCRVSEIYKQRRAALANFLEGVLPLIYNVSFGSEDSGD